MGSSVDADLKKLHGMNSPRTPQESQSIESTNLSILHTSPKTHIAIIPYPNGTYQGEWIEGSEVGSDLSKVRHGKGTMKYFNGNEYSGDFLRDCFNGVGQYTWADGKVFHGTFKDDKINGKGVAEWPDGRRYEGDYVNDLAEGHGVVWLPDGRLFEGRRAPIPAKRHVSQAESRCERTARERRRGRKRALAMPMPGDRSHAGRFAPRTAARPRSSAAAPASILSPRPDRREAARPRP